MPYEIWGQKVKGQGHKARITENGFWRTTASPLHWSSWNFTCSLSMSRVWTLWTLGSKGQRSRSQCKDYWRWFQAHNCFPFTPILMKLHMQSPHESSMGPMDFKVKGQGHNARITENGFWRITASPFWRITWGVWIGCRVGYFVPLGQPHSSLFIEKVILSDLLIKKPRYGGSRRRNTLACDDALVMDCKYCTLGLHSFAPRDRFYYS